MIQDACSKQRIGLLPNAPPASAQIALDQSKQNVYCSVMIHNFASAETEHFFTSGKSRRFPEDLRLPPSNRLEALAHERAGQWSIRINEQWRVGFRFENGDAYDVEIVDYH